MGAVRTAATVVGVVIALVVAACAGSSPDIDAWAEQWRDIAGAVPDDPDAYTPTSCEEFLVDLREARGELIPAPTAALEEAVDRWIAAAEELAFDCPPPGGFEAGLDRLATLEDEVEAALPGS